MVSALTRLVNMSFEDGVFRRALKHACVIIDFKGGSRNDPAKYHPRSLLSALSKIFERAMISQLLDFLNSKIFFHDSQFGFRAKQSTEHKCTNLLNYIHTFLDSSLIPATLSLNVCRALDSITHKIFF